MAEGNGRPRLDRGPATAAGFDRKPWEPRPAELQPGAASDQTEVSPKKLAAFATYLIDARRKRDAMFADIDFGEPAWDILLDLYVQHVEGRGVSVTGLCVAAAVPATTALRWINVMVERGHLSREPDAHDRRRVFIRLDARLLATIEAHLRDARRRALKALQ